VLRPCDICGTSYEAKRANSKYCSASCRKRASRGAVPLSETVTVLPGGGAGTDAPGPGPVESALLSELRHAERESSVLGQAALALARRVDAARDTGAGLASLVKQLEATAKAATADVKSADSRLDKARDQLAERRAARGA
jgi:hypothetical protein